MNCAKSSSLCLKYQRFTPSGCKDIGIRTFEFVAKEQFLCEMIQRIPSFFIAYYISLNRSEQCILNEQ